MNNCGMLRLVAQCKRRRQKEYKTSSWISLLVKTGHQHGLRWTGIINSETEMRLGTVSTYPESTVF